MPNNQKNCRKVGDRVVCGMLHSGGQTKRAGVYRLAKGEKVYSPAQLKALASKAKHQHTRSASPNPRANASTKYHS